MGQVSLEGSVDSLVCVGFNVVSLAYRKEWEILEKEIVGVCGGYFFFWSFFYYMKFFFL